MERELPRLEDAVGEGREVEHSGTSMARCECEKSDAKRELASVLLGIAAEEEGSHPMDDDCGRRSGYGDGCKGAQPCCLGAFGFPAQSVPSPTPRKSQWPRNISPPVTAERSTRPPTHPPTLSPSPSPPPRLDTHLDLLVMASTSASTSTTSSPHSFSIVGRNLKLNTAQDIRPILDELEKVQPLEEVHFGGNTLGVEACQALADVLKSKKDLKVRKAAREADVMHLQ